MLLENGEKANAIPNNGPGRRKGMGRNSPEPRLHSERNTVLSRLAAGLLALPAPLAARATDVGLFRAEPRRERVDKGLVFVGAFRLKDTAYIDAMPVHNDSGLWQVWKIPDGFFMVQPLDQNMEPWGTMYLLEGQELGRMLAPLPPADDSAPSAQPGHEGQPDILALWYEQAIAEQEAAENDDKAAEPSLRKKPGAVPSTPSREQERPDEPVLTPSWDPDEFFFDADNAAPAAVEIPTRSLAGRVPPVSPARIGSASPPDAGGPVTPAEAAKADGAPASTPAPMPVRVDSPSPPKGAGGTLSGPACIDPVDEEELLADALAAEADSSANPLDFMPPLSFEADSETPPAAAGRVAREPLPAPAASAFTVEIAADDEEALEFRDDDAYADARAQRLEQRMRGEFETLMERVDSGGGAGLERELSRLILQGAGFSWKQKFMFTEFGFALRRKRLYKLALTCHMRALALAPADEHVLFNVARAEYELGKAEAARIYLLKALEAAPAFGAARRFLAFLDGCANDGQ